MTTLKSRVGTILIPILPMSWRSFDILRYEITALKTRATNSFSIRHRRRLRQLRKGRGLSLNIGSGGHGLPDWINIELRRHRDTTLCLDIRRPLPFSNGSVKRILIEHVLEHVDFREDVPRMLSDFYRVLEPGGILRIIVPDGGRFAKAYASNDSEAWHNLGWGQLPPDIVTPMHALNHVFHQSGEHLFAYDFDTLSLVLRDMGFNKVEKTSFRQSRDPKLAIDQENHALYSLYVEAVK